MYRLILDNKNEYIHKVDICRFGYYTAHFGRIRTFLEKNKVIVVNNFMTSIRLCIN